MPFSTKFKTGFLAVLLLSLGGLTGWGLVHDGRSAALEAAVPLLELKKNPFILRETWWDGMLKEKEQKLIEHQLFKRNEYWFWVGCSQSCAKVNIHIYDQNGNLVEDEAWEKGNVAAARVIPEASGTYYVRVFLESSDELPAEWAVIYAYR